jgi:hypothetical protein
MRNLARRSVHRIRADASADLAAALLEVLRRRSRAGQPTGEVRLELRERLNVQRHPGLNERVVRGPHVPRLLLDEQATARVTGELNPHRGHCALDCLADERDRYRGLTTIEKSDHRIGEGMRVRCQTIDQEPWQDAAVTNPDVDRVG